MNNNVMNTWTPLWSGIVDSSLWEENGNVVKVFITILATKDSDHVCRLTPYAIAKKCNLPEVEVLEILKILASPDKRRVQEQKFDGRRIQACEDGWLVLNGEKYREQVKIEMQKARNRRSQAAYRERIKTMKHGIPIRGEPEFVKKLESGASEAELDAHVEANITLPASAPA